MRLTHYVLAYEEVPPSKNIKVVEVICGQAQLQGAGA